MSLRSIACWLLAMAGGHLLFWPIFFWFYPIGTGEYRLSPDRRFTAHAKNMSFGTISGERRYYLRITVVDHSTDREVWRIVYEHPVGADVPDFGRRDKRYVTWSADSRTVTMPGVGGQPFVLSMP